MELAAKYVQTPVRVTDVTDPQSGGSPALTIAAKSVATLPKKDVPEMHADGLIMCHFLR